MKATDLKGVDLHDFLRRIPKADLHVHLDGSLRLETLLALAKEQGVELPADTAEGLRREVFKSDYDSLAEYLRPFSLTVAVLRTAAALERVAYELAVDSYAEMCCYVEVRFCPQLHAHSELSLRGVIEAVDRGMRRARDEINVSAAVAAGETPPFAYSMIIIAMRSFVPQMSPYYAAFWQAHEGESTLRIHQLGAMVAAVAAVNARDSGLPVYGFDIAGDEVGHPTLDYVDAFTFCRDAMLFITVHAGEAAGPLSIGAAVNNLHCDRIGHGFHLLDTSMVEGKDEAEAQRYVDQLSNVVAQRRVCLEVCLTSNRQTHPRMHHLQSHSFSEFLKRGLCMALCTDNRLVSDTSLTDEYIRAAEHFDLSLQQIRQLSLNGFKRSFFPGTYLDKVGFLEKVIDYYTKLEERMLVGVADRYLSLSRNLSTDNLYALARLAAQERAAKGL